MVKYIFGTAFIWFIITTSGNAQSVYSKSIENSVSAAYSFGMTDTDRNMGFGVAYTLKSNVDFGLIYTLHHDRTGRYANGEGWGGFVSFMLMNELKGDPVGLSLGFTYSQAAFEDDYYSFNSKSAGLGFILSKSIENEDEIITAVPQISFSFLPINEIDRRYEADVYQYNLTSTLAIGFPFQVHPIASLIVELSTTYNYRAKLFVPGLSVALLLH